MVIGCGEVSQYSGGRFCFFSVTEVYVFRGCDCGVRGW